MMYWNNNYIALNGCLGVCEAPLTNTQERKSLRMVVASI